MAKPTTLPASEVLDLLAAIREAITLPDGADYEDEQTRRRLLDRRAVALASTLDLISERAFELPLTPAWYAGTLRTRMTEYPPVGYQQAGRTPEKVATITAGPGLSPGTVMYCIDYAEDGQATARSYARPEDLDEWRTDLAAQGWTVVDAAAEQVEGGER